MAFKSFQVNCVFRIILMVLSIFLFFYLIYWTSLFATISIVGIVIIIQIISLIHYVNKTNRDLSGFLTSIKYSDFSKAFTSGQKGSSYDQLNEAFTEVISEFQKARFEKEEQYRYLQTLVHHIRPGVLSFEQNGDVDLINNAAKRLLGLNHLKNINSLRSLSPLLVEKLLNHKRGERELVKIEIEGEALTLAIDATDFRLQNRQITLVSMQNIESELAEQEMEAWQKLIRVLTHEIMNSITPIASLATTVNELISETEKTENIEKSDLNYEIREDIKQASATIEKRSKGLLRFVQAYRNLTRIPIPNFEIFKIMI